MSKHSYQTNIPIQIPLRKYLHGTVVVTTKDTGKTVRIMPFTDGQGRTYFRFSTPEPDAYTYKHAGGRGSFTVSKYRGSNKLYKHGGIRLSSDKKILEHADGTLFAWLADTWWYASTGRMNMPKFRSLLNIRVEQKFSVIQLVVGVSPEVDVRNPNAANEGGLPFNEKGGINPAYFDNVDKKINMLAHHGMVPCIVGGWGHHINILGIEAITNLWKEIIARYGSYPVVFCITGEVDGYPVASVDKQASYWKRIVAFVNKSTSSHINRILRSVNVRVRTVVTKGSRQSRIEDWKRVAAYVQRNDPYKRIRMIHVRGTQTAFDVFGTSKGLLTINTIQSGHSVEGAGPMIGAIRTQVAKNTPILNMEPWYEGILGNFAAKHQRYAFWASILNGAMGHSYGAHGIWNMGTRGDRFMSHWGKSDWVLAQQFSGAKDLGCAMQFVKNHNILPCVSVNSINPSWSLQEVDKPFVGQAASGNTIVYFPKVDIAKSYTIDNAKIQLPATASWIDPSTMNTIVTEKITSMPYNVIIPNHEKSEDMIVFISPKKSS